MSSPKMNFEPVSLDQVMQQIALGEISEVITSASQSVNEMKDESSNDPSLEALQYPQWQKPFRDAMIELDREKIEERVEVARLAIADRIKSLAQGPGAPAEQRALVDALASLRVLLREVL
jgi:hypothetical protein